MSRRLTRLAFATCALSACSGSDDDMGGDDEGSSSSSGASGAASSSGASGSWGASSGGTPGACLDPASFDYVVPLRTEGDAYLIGYDMRVDGTTLFMNGVHSVFALNTASSAFDAIYTDAATIVPFMFPRAADVLIYVGNRKLLSVPKTGGTPTPLPAFTRRPLTSLAGTADLELDGDSFYAKEVDEGTRFFKHDVTTGAETDLAQEDRARNASFRIGADAIYGYYPTTEEPNAPTQMFRLPKAGGAIEPLGFTGALPVLYPYAVRGTDLYLIGSNPTDATGTLYRAPTTGGAAAPLMTTVFPLAFKGQSQAFDAEGGTVFRLVDTFFWLPTGAATAAKLACIGGDFTLHASAAIGKTIYASVVNSGSNVGGVIRIPIP